MPRPQRSGTGCVGIVRRLCWRERGCWRVRRLGLLRRKQIARVLPYF
ncbi:hypothetical protein ES319_A11G120300v1 [Gossypium barbadense]|uniref:Uncharacterized protein n=1 Tax=Gossypium barbadense TaxID=3634 RepID=A0A5J5TLU0_GOSBA|nr:hypothetical protein ES319_A11G120300v1 [Gossypium barbadense]